MSYDDPSYNPFYRDGNEKPSYRELIYDDPSYIPFYMDMDGDERCNHSVLCHLTAKEVRDELSKVGMDKFLRIYIPSRKRSRDGKDYVYKRERLREYLERFVLGQSLEIDNPKLISQLKELQSELPKLDRDHKPFDILIGYPEDPTLNPFFDLHAKKQCPTLICLWHQGVPPNYKSIFHDDMMLHLYPNLNWRNITISNNPPANLFTVQRYFMIHHTLVSWVSWGTVDNRQEEGWLVGLLQEGIYCYNEKPLPFRYQGEPVYSVTSYYQTTIGINGGKRVDTLMIGDQIAPADMEQGYGTLGAFIKDKNDKVYILSNQHVLQTTDRPNDNDKRILQPDQGSMEEEPLIDQLVVANYITGTRNNFPISQGNSTYQVGMDVAIAELVDRPFLVKYRKERYLRTNEFKSYQLTIKSPIIGSKVYKCGATTEVTSGLITSQNYPIKVHPIMAFYSSIVISEINNSVNISIKDYPSITLHNQVIISSSTRQTANFAESGDSGSMVIDEDGYPVGLLHGKTSNFAIMTDLTAVMSYLATIIEQPELLPYGYSSV